MKMTATEQPSKKKSGQDTPEVYNKIDIDLNIAFPCDCHKQITNTHRHLPKS